jgi:hypothetical protein
MVTVAIRQLIVLTVYIECNMRGAKDPGGSFTRSRAALVQQLSHQGLANESLKPNRSMI